MKGFLNPRGKLSVHKKKRGRRQGKGKGKEEFGQVSFRVDRF